MPEVPPRPILAAYNAQDKIRKEQKKVSLVQRARLQSTAHTPPEHRLQTLGNTGPREKENKENRSARMHNRRLVQVARPKSTHFMPHSLPGYIHREKKNDTNSCPCLGIGRDEAFPALICPYDSLLEGHMPEVLRPILVRWVYEGTWEQ